MKKYQKILLMELGGLLLMGAIIAIGYFAYSRMKPTLTVREYIEKIDVVVKDAQSNNDLALCNQLPERLDYLDYHPQDGKGVGTPNRWTKGNPRNECIIKFVNKTTDPDVCESIIGRDDLIDRNSQLHTSDDCFERMSEIYSDPSYCDRMSWPDLTGVVRSDSIIKCKAIAALDVEHCYSMTQNVSGCILDVVLRTDDIEPCLAINGTNFGEYWRRSRNECVASVGYELKQKKEPTKWLCDQMVEADPDTPDFLNIKDRCARGEFSSYGGVKYLLPKRIKMPND